MNFIDEAKIFVAAGSGGNGCTAFRREKFMPKGGPSGGDGGNGGSVIFYASTRITTLLDFKYRRKYAAERGQHGMGRDKYGKSGKDLRLPVPIGTAIYNDETGELIGDLIEDGQEIVVAEGGLGGFGNIHFATPSNQAPQRSDPGTPGEEIFLKLNLKLLADVGLLGLPNAGKSTLLSIVSAAKPNIANYPFTTLIPNLGVVKIDDERAFVMADIPGLVEGASHGKGLGHRFLKHLERTAILLHLVEYPLEGIDRDPLEEVEILERELSNFDERLASLPKMVVMTKIDLCSNREELLVWEKKFAPRKFTAISAVTREGKIELLEKVWKIIHPAKGDSHEFGILKK